MAITTQQLLFTVFIHLLVSQSQAADTSTLSSFNTQSAITTNKTNADNLIVTDQDQIKKLQKQLNELGFDVGTPDGLIGKNINYSFSGLFTYSFQIKLIFWIFVFVM